MVIGVGQGQCIHGPRSRRFRFAVVAAATLSQCSECRVAVQRVRARDLVGRARNVGSVVVAVARLMVAIGKDGQMALRVRCHELWLRASIVEGLLASVELQVRAFLGSSAETFSARVALAAVVVNWRVVRVVVVVRAVCELTLRVALVFKLVFLVATIALGVVRLGLASTTTVLTLLDGATLRVDML
jgi:hypothetical protein